MCDRGEWRDSSGAAVAALEMAASAISLSEFESALHCLQSPHVFHSPYCNLNLLLRHCIFIVIPQCPFYFPVADDATKNEL